MRKLLRLYRSCKNTDGQLRQLADSLGWPTSKISLYPDSSSVILIYFTLTFGQACRTLSSRVNTPASYTEHLVF
jgi:hypothetical protein